MTSKEYLSQAYQLDKRINAKISQVASLNELATKCTSTITGMPHAPSKSTSTMADTITKIIDLEHEINSDIDRLVDLKREMVRAIKAVGNTEYQTILELRYLCFESWEQISMALHLSIQHTFRLHSRALKEFKIPQKKIKVESKCD